MIVADTSALVSLAAADLLETTFREFEVHTTAVVIGELEATANYDDDHGEAAATVLESTDAFEVHDVDPAPVRSSRIDEGEASSLALERELDAEFLLTDDLRALPELQSLADARVAISPLVLRALVTRGAITDAAARERLDRLARTRDWLGAPIYRRARDLFEN
jgi:predicted nucleic acid-binding protein